METNVKMLAPFTEDENLIQFITSGTAYATKLQTHCYNSCGHGGHQSSDYRIVEIALSSLGLT